MVIALKLGGLLNSVSSGNTPIAGWASPNILSMKIIEIPLKLVGLSNIMSIMEIALKLSGFPLILYIYWKYP